MLNVLQCLKFIIGFLFFDTFSRTAAMRRVGTVVNKISMGRHFVWQKFNDPSRVAAWPLSFPKQRGKQVATLFGKLVCLSTRPLCSRSLFIKLIDSVAMRDRRPEKVVVSTCSMIRATTSPEKGNCLSFHTSFQISKPRCINQQTRCCNTLQISFVSFLFNSALKKKQKFHLVNLFFYQSLFSNLFISLFKIRQIKLIISPFCIKRVNVKLKVINKIWLWRNN